MSNQEFIQKFYLGFYGRAAEPDGLNYWVEEAEEKGWTTVRDEFAESDEADEFVFTDPQGEPYDYKELVNNIYQNLFGRDAEGDPDDPETGLGFYVSKLEAGEMTLDTIVHNVIAGAQNEDAEVLDAKLEAAQHFTEQVEEQDREYGEDQIPDARTALEGDSTDPAYYKGKADDVIGAFPLVDDPELSIEAHRTFTFSPEEQNENGYTMLGVKVAETAGEEAQDPELQLELDGQAVDPFVGPEPHLPDTLENESASAWSFYWLQPGDYQGEIILDAENADSVQEEVDFTVPEHDEPAANIFVAIPLWPGDPYGVIGFSSFENFEESDTLYLDVYDDQGNSLTYDFGRLKAQEEDESGYHNHSELLHAFQLEDKIGAEDEIQVAAYETEADAQNQENPLDELVIPVDEDPVWGTEEVEEALGFFNMQDTEVQLQGVQNDSWDEEAAMLQS